MSTSGVVIKPNDNRVRSTCSSSAGGAVEGRADVRHFVALLRQVDGRGRLRRARHAQKHDVGLVQLLRVAAVVVGDGELDGLDAPEVVLVGNVQAARLRGRPPARHVRDMAPMASVTRSTATMSSPAGVFGQLTREVAIDERVEHEHAPIAGVALVHGAVLVDELLDLLERAHLRQHLDDGVRDAELGGGRTGHRLPSDPPSR